MKCREVTVKKKCVETFTVSGPSYIYYYYYVTDSAAAVSPPVGARPNNAAGIIIYMHTCTTCTYRVSRPLPTVTDRLPSNELPHSLWVGFTPAHGNSVHGKLVLGLHSNIICSLPLQERGRASTPSQYNTASTTPSTCITIQHSQHYTQYM